MRCWLTRRRLDAYQDGEISPAVRVRVESHVAGCARCSRELGQLRRLRAALAVDVPGPSEAAWDAFWPQVRARIAQAPPHPEPAWHRVWATVSGRPGLVLAPAAAAAALALLVVAAPWQRAPRPTLPAGPSPAAVQPGALDQVVIQSIETGDPDLPVMVYASPDSDLTVLWVFGLERTGV